MRYRSLGALFAATLILCSALLLPGRAEADAQARDPVTAATLLFPYFEVDLDDPAGSNTVLSVRNASATAVLGNVTVWTDTGYPILNFPIYMTGYDVTNIDVGAMLRDGILPVTASAGQDPTDQISPHGPISQDINFASCGNWFSPNSAILPFTVPELTATTIEYMQQALTGQPVTLFSGQCASFDHGDRIARGYVTVDTVNQCYTGSVTDPGYFISGGGGVATLQNVLTGEYFLRGGGGRLLHSSLAVALEASFADHNVAGNYTFYGRLPYVNWLAFDNREPLNGHWGLDAQAAGSELIVWRDTKSSTANSSGGRFTCASFDAPTALPLGVESETHFDNSTGTYTPTLELGLATQRVRLPAPTSGKPGWSVLNLNTTIAGNANPSVDPAAAAAYVEVIQFPEVDGQGGGAVAIPLDTGNAAQHTPLP